jgi:UDP-N-acetylmuramyl pentapeptide phosphotransferase/UDP-N-acetylglucosamine-1-phosphate transferase
MNQPKQKQYLFDNPANVSLVIRSLYFVCILLFLLDFILHRHATNTWDGINGFYVMYGFIAYVAIVLGAFLLRKLVKRNENYYDVDE